MAEVQEKLKNCVEKQSLESLDKLADIFDAAQEEHAPESMDTTTDVIGIDAVDDDAVSAKDLKGENRAPPARKAKRSRKHGLKAATKSKLEELPKRRPKYFVQF
jgi:hypothetical protein